jgi:hypothetical protein
MSNLNTDFTARRQRQMVNDAHDLMPADLAAQMPRLYATEALEDINSAIVYAKFFTPDSSWTWYALEFSPDERLCFGLVIGFASEMGYFSLDEMRTARGPRGLKIERDLWFAPTPLGDVRSGKTR